MFNRKFAPRPHLVLNPNPTPEEVDEAVSGHDVLAVYAIVCDSLNVALRSRPSEASRISDEFATLLTAILTASPEASSFDHFDLSAFLSNLPRVILAMTYNHFLCDDFVRETTTIDAPLKV